MTVRSRESENSPRAALIARAGIPYTTAMPEKADIVIEATGSPSAALRGLNLLAPLGVMVVLGTSVAEGRVSFTDLVVHNQVIAGSVNASPESFAWAVQDLGRRIPARKWCIVFETVRAASTLMN